MLTAILPSNKNESVDAPIHLTAPFIYSVGYYHDADLGLSEILRKLTDRFGNQFAAQRGRGLQQSDILETLQRYQDRFPSVVVRLEMNKWALLLSRSLHTAIRLKAKHAPLYSDEDAALLSLTFDHYFATRTRSSGYAHKNHLSRNDLISSDALWGEDKPVYDNLVTGVAAIAALCSEVPFILGETVLLDHARERGVENLLLGLKEEIGVNTKLPLQPIDNQETSNIFWYAVEYIAWLVRENPFDFGPPI